MSAIPKALNIEPESLLPTLQFPSALAVERRPAAAAVPGDAGEILYLTGWPKLKDFLHFVHDNAIESQDEARLITEWRAAKDHLGILEKTEARCADHPVISKIEVGPKYESLLIEFLKDPLVKNGFNTVPTEVAFVALDQLVVYQKHIDLAFVRQLQAQLGPTPSDEDIFRTCLPGSQPRAPVKWSRLDDESYVFVSPSNDLRFLGTMRLKPDHIKDYPPPGALVGVIGLAIGFGSNFLNAVYCENRLVLNNGSHRAYALREMGVTHVPCVVQHVATRDELEVVATSKLRRDPDLYLKHSRPSMLKDYFNPKLRIVMPVHRQLRQLKVRFSVSEYFVPAL